MTTLQSHLLLLLFGLFGLFGLFITNNNPITTVNIFDQVNKVRINERQKPLKSDPTLIKSATWKANQLCSSGVFAHNLQNMTWQDFFVNVDPSINIIGENLATDQISTEQVINQWMQSLTHKNNILGEFTITGVAVKSCNNKMIIVQHFGKL